MRKGWELSQKNPMRQDDILRQSDNLQKLWQQLQDEIADRKSRLQAAALIKQVRGSAGVCDMWDMHVAQFCPMPPHGRQHWQERLHLLVFKKISGSEVSILLQARHTGDLSSWEML